jgi:hypothetical protein
MTPATTDSKSGKQYRTGYNDAYQDSFILGHRRILAPNTDAVYASGYNAAWRIYGSK